MDNNKMNELGLGERSQEALNETPMEAAFQKFHAGLQEIILKSSRHQLNLDQFVNASRDLFTDHYAGAFMDGVETIKDQGGNLSNAKRLLEEAKEKLNGGS